jgi:hypothetical protein
MDHECDALELHGFKDGKTADQDQEESGGGGV